MTDAPDPVLRNQEVLQFLSGIRAEAERLGIFVVVAAAPDEQVVNYLKRGDPTPASVDWEVAFETGAMEQAKARHLESLKGNEDAVFERVHADLLFLFSRSACAIMLQGGTGNFNNEPFVPGGMSDPNANAPEAPAPKPRHLQPVPGPENDPPEPGEPLGD